MYCFYFSFKMIMTFLGTSCMVPTKERNVTGIFLKYRNEGILFDCGEGTQRQMNIAGIKRHEVTKILISHWHADHVSGLPGLLQTIGNMVEDARVELYGPKETKERIAHMMKMTVFESKVDLKIKELEPGGLEKFFENDDFILEAVKLKHNTPCIGFRFTEKDRRRINMAKAKKLGLREGPLIGKLQQGNSIELKGKKIKSDDVSYIVKGKKIAVMLDTTFCENTIKLAQDADLLVAESAFLDELAEKAEKFKHMTAKQCALVASNAGAKKLILTHFSQRYKTAEPLLQEARDIFPETEAAYDFMKVKL